MTDFPSQSELQRVRSKLNEGIASRPLPKNAGPVKRVKFRICEKFVVYKNTENLTQGALAKIIGIDESLMSKILHYHFDEFTTDRLIKYLAKIYPKIDLKLDFVA